jgi:pimeloyl-ACP methyl ester carboxylesterase
VDSQQGLAEVNRTRLHNEVAGTGEPVVLIHGLGSDLRVWDAQFPVFAQHNRVLRYDIRGHGKSALPTSEPYAHADDLKALLDHCDMSRAHVIGQSIGGEIAINFALAYPERVQSLVLVDSTISGFQWSDDWNASWLPVFAAASTKGKEGILELALRHPLFASAMENPAVAPRLTQILSEYSAWHFLNADPVQHPERPAIQRLDQIRMPTLIIVGEHDLPDFHAIAAILQQHIPIATRLDVAGVGHVVPMEAPERLNEMTLGFLAGL